MAGSCKHTRHAVCNIETLSPMHSCRGNATTSAYSERERESVCVCSLSYPTCKTHASYYVTTCGFSGSTISFHITSKTTRFSGGKKLLKLKCVLKFSLQLSPDIFLILRKTQRDIILTVQTSSCKVPVLLARFLTKQEFPRQIFENT
jgi:hypothetical protein